MLIAALPQNCRRCWHPAEWPSWKSATAKPLPSTNLFVRQNSSHAEQFATWPVFPAASLCSQITSPKAKKAWQSCHDAVSFRLTWKNEAPAPDSGEAGGAQISVALVEENSKRAGYDRPESRVCGPEEFVLRTKSEQCRTR